MTSETTKASTCLVPFLRQAYARESSSSTRSVTQRQPEILLPSSLLVVYSATTMMLACYFPELNPAARTQMMIPVNQICLVICNQPFLLRLHRSGRPSVFGMNLVVQIKFLAIEIFTIKEATKNPDGLSFKLLTPSVFGTHLLASSSPRHFRRIQQQQCH